MIFRDIICPFCACLCDDLVVEVEEDRVIRVDNACTLGTETYLGSDRLETPLMRDGDVWRNVSYDEAIRYTAEILTDADYPLLYGWSGTTTEAQSLGLHIAELVGGVIDSTSTVCHGPSILAIQEVGHPGCTLGQVKNRADVVIYWGCNAINAHPRHMSRYTTFTDGFFVRDSFNERTLIVVDTRRNETAAIADEFLKVLPGGDYAVLSALRALVRGRGGSVPKTVAGVPREQLVRIADICKNARFGTIFFGLGLTMSRGKHKNIRNAIELVDELNRHTKFTISPMRGHGNVYGSNEVFTWMSGYPFAVDYSRGIAFYNPGETSAVDILSRKECDACLVVASDPGAHFPRACWEHLASIPTVLIDPHRNMTTFLSRAQIPVAMTGIDGEGTVYRMDGVPIRTRKVIDTGIPSDVEVLGKVMDLIKGRAGP